MKLRNSYKKKLIKAANNFAPFDYGYLLDIQKEAFKLMYEHFSKGSIMRGDYIVARDLKICIKLLDIIDSGGKADGIYVNLKNAYRFSSEWGNLELYRNITRLDKAWSLYNKIISYKMRGWWN